MGHQKPGVAVANATANKATSATISTAATLRARRVRSSVLPRRASTAASFSGVRARNASTVARPRHNAATLCATSRPSSTGSRVSPQPPCSLGRATERSGDRALVGRRVGLDGAAAPSKPDPLSRTSTETVSAISTRSARPAR